MENQKSTKATASLVLGIIACALPVVLGIYGSIIGVVCGIISIIMGVKAKKETTSGIATAGFILGIIGTVLSGLVFIACACFMGALTEFSTNATL